MATVQGMSGVDLVAVTAEIRTFLPLWIHKIYQGDRKICIIRLNSKEKIRYNLLIEPGRRMHLISSLPDLPKIPPQFAMLLRKYLTGGRLINIRQKGLQRTIILDVQKADQVYHLIFEFFDEGNIVLCSEDYTIIQPLTRQKFKDRDVLPQRPYLFPPPDVAEIDQESFATRLREDERDIVRSLAIGSFLGGMYAEYICRETGTRKDLPAKEADPVKIYQAIHHLLNQVSTERSGVITGSGCHPLYIEGEILKGPFGLYNEALAEFYPEQPREEKKTRPKIPKEERIRMQQLASISKFERNIKKNEEQVEKIYEEYQYVQEVITTLSTAAEHHSWQEIEEILKKDTTGAGKKIRGVNPADASVDLDLGTLVTIHVNETIDQNAGRYYDQIKKFKKKRAGAEAAMEKTVVRTEHRSEGYVRPKKKWFYRFRWFYTSDNVLAIGGKDAGQNEELVKRYMEGKDSFVHADVHGSSVVIVKGETTCWDEIAQFAASFSGGWRAGHFTADVYAAGSEQVSKTAESGEYLSRGSFVVRGERRWFRDVPLGVAIGLVKKPATMIIGGPLSAVQKRAELIVQIQPGGFEPNDIAKKVVRMMREKLSPADQKALKFALNTEAIAAFVPPGGSDIVEES